MFWDIVPMPKALVSHAVHELIVGEAERWQPPIEPIAQDAVRVHSYGSWSTFHRIAKDMIEMIDGRRTLREIGQAVAGSTELGSKTSAPRLSAICIA